MGDENQPIPLHIALLLLVSGGLSSASASASW